MTYWKGSCEKHIHLCFMFQMFNGEQYKALNKELADAVREWQSKKSYTSDLSGDKINSMLKEAAKRSGII